jgi:hypothetical protein
MAAISWRREMPNAHAKMGVPGVVKSLNAVSSDVVYPYTLYVSVGGWFEYVDDVDH